jgi:hypothetical protein
MGARHYSPSLGRFVQPDPSGAENNLYGYTSNSPITKIDPTGTIGRGPAPPGGKPYNWRLNPAEQRLCAQDPAHCAAFWWAAGWAQAMVTWRYRGTTRNAMRHCIWQCLLTFESGAAWAVKWANAHESTPTSSAEDRRDRRIDRHNNVIGRSLGRRRLGFVAAWGALNLCAAEFNADHLWVEINGRIYWSNSRPMTLRRH